MNKPDKPKHRKDVKIVQRGDELAHGSRTGTDRRGDDRGLDAGRRMVDHRRVRQAFEERITEMIAIGISPATIARILNDEEETTAHGAAWTESAIQQLLNMSEQRVLKAAWSPLSQSGEDSSKKNKDPNHDG